MYSWIPKNPYEHQAASRARAMGVTSSIEEFQDFKKAAPFTAASLTHPEADRYIGSVSIGAGGASSSWRKVTDFSALYEAENGTRLSGPAVGAPNATPPCDEASTLQSAVQSAAPTK